MFDLKKVREDTTSYTQDVAFNQKREGAVDDFHHAQQESATEGKLIAGKILVAFFRDGAASCEGALVSMETITAGEAPKDTLKLPAYAEKVAADIQNVMSTHSENYRNGINLLNELMTKYYIEGAVSHATQCNIAKAAENTGRI